MKTENKDDFILVPAGENLNCFGCSLKNKSGLKMKFYTTK